ncbi:preprotein translocase subunit SecG [Qipengyuania flava]|jgi:preprotein translocase subunit SecG|uniref:preprotein translocase subunit SecG n=1 Tax=Qipengyuania flava TaxID=192812 RepID=UPI00141B18FC|nr:preprotein translocase subunit SecG [Qipengyuania flava]NIJ60811.1 preprotein translocase subunit SecG [Qipengyuania flava]
MFLFLTVVQAIIAAALVGVILMQRSEGGGLGIGGSPSGMLSARGAADFLTRSTKWLAVLFVVLSIALAAVAVETTGSDAIESTLDRTVAPAAPADPLGPATTGEAAPASAPADADPLSGATE